MGNVIYRYRGHCVVVAGRDGDKVVLEDVKTGEKIKVTGTTFMSDEVVFVERMKIGVK